MNFRLTRTRNPGERGQAMIFTAVIMSALMGTLGMSIEGGRIYVEYRQLQSAADMAALVGAQGLPCKTSDPNCAPDAEKLACEYAVSNGYGDGINGHDSCTAFGNGATSWASVPPQSCSPYDFMDYGNGGSNGNCKTATTPSLYDYIEVHLNDNLGTIPIFDIPVTLSAHAVAKHGPITGGDFAFISLSHTTPLTLIGNPTVQVTGSVFSNGGIQAQGSANAHTCDGGWFSAGSVSGVSSNTNGTPTFSPPGCLGSDDSTPDAQSSLPQLSDPYAGSSPPPSSASSFPNCSECASDGWWYNLDDAIPNDPMAWQHGGTPSGDVEMFPGTYTSLNSNMGNVYMNPGVYTFTSPISLEHGQFCVYGSPACGSTGSSSCASSSLQGDTWYYACSPYGSWDSALAAQKDLQEPTFYDPATGAASTTPLNGVTIYLPVGSGLVKANGNSSSTGGTYLAAPDPCPGTGAFSDSPPAVSFPAGSADGVFTYDPTYLSNNPNLPTTLTSSIAGQVYPSDDFSLEGECGSDLLVWPGEMTKSQHLHFLIYATDSTSMTLNGTATQDLTGIVYAPNATLGVSGNHNQSQGDGPPWINGQVVVNNGDLGGNGSTSISYRPCGPGSTVCGSGTGTQLVE